MRAAAERPAARSGAELWQRARAVRTQVKLTKRWHGDVDRWYKRLWLTCKVSHTLLAGLFFRGTAGFSRAQTVQILSNSLVLEIVILCMQYIEEEPSDGEEAAKVEVNLVEVVVAGTVAAGICIPGMMLFAASFHPQIIVNLAKLVLSCPVRVWRLRWTIVRGLCCWPCAVRKLVNQMLLHTKRKERKEKWAKACRGSLELQPGAVPLHDLMDQPHEAPPPPRRSLMPRLSHAAKSSLLVLRPSRARRFGSHNRGGSAAPMAAGDGGSGGAERARPHHLATTATPMTDATAAEGDEEDGWAGGEEAGCGEGPVNQNASLTTRLRFAAAAVRAEEAGAAGAGVMTLADRSRGSVAQARWDILCSAPVVDEMQRDVDEADEDVRKRSIIDFMRAKLAQHKTLHGEDLEERYTGERVFRYDSLNEHLVMLSLTRAIKYKQHKRTLKIATGWLLNHAFFTMLLLVFMTYGCRFEEESDLSEKESQELLMYSWAWSIMQRFAVNEPVIIMVGVLLPMLFATECCANMCTESCNNMMGVAVAMLITFLKRLRR